MNKKITDKSTDISPVIDRSENLSLMEPLSISERFIQQYKLIDLVLELTAKSAGFKNSLPSAIQTSLANLVRSMIS